MRGAGVGAALRGRRQDHSISNKPARELSIQSIYGSARWLAGRAMDARIWRPTHAELMWRQLVYQNRNRDAGLGDSDHLSAAAQWLARAQDVTGDGGVAGRYQLGKGWSSSYPETTGYIIPTFIALATELRSGRFLERAQRAIDFLLPLQFADGGFPGGEVRENTTQPSAFNTAQILGGLIAWHAISPDDLVLDAACRAGTWLMSIQSPDGAWRQHAYNQVPVTYSSHAACWLAELGRHTGDPCYLDAAAKHFEWVLSQQDVETGWIDGCGFSREDHEHRRAVTHTIAYTLWGLLISSDILKRSDGVEAVEKAAAGIARRLELSGRLPGVLDHCWRPRAPYACLTGNAQMALVWLRLYALRRDPRFLNAALKALDHVKAVQPMSNANPGIQGGIPGSSPIWGDYIYLGLPNWAAKFFIDALMAKKAALSTILSDTSAPPTVDWQLARDLPQALPDVPEQSPGRAVKVIMYSSPGSQKVQQMVTAWSGWQFKPAAVVIEKRPEPGFTTRLVKRIAADGLGWVFARVLQRTARSSGGGARSLDLACFCNERGIPVIEVGLLDSAESVAVVSAFQPDLAIHAGAGILREPLLRIPRLGTLNAHMGILPYYRGMNVAEWSFFQAGPVGCTVHLIDSGIDTGDILCVRRVSTTRVSDISGLRARVDDAQISLLGEVVRSVLRTGLLPPRRKQTPGEGRQFFGMHPEIVMALETRFRSNAPAGGRHDAIRYLHCDRPMEASMVRHPGHELGYGTCLEDGSGQ